jgi:hypothetical protein
MAAHKTVVESSSYTEARRLLEVDCKRLDEILEGIVWELSRRPQDFPRAPYTDLYCIATAQFTDIPSLWIWYVFDEHTVTLEHIEHADYGEPF